MTTALAPMPEEKRQAYLKYMEMTRMMCKEISMVYDNAIPRILVYPDGRVVWEYSSEVEEVLAKIRQRWFGVIHPVKGKKGE